MPADANIFSASPLMHDHETLVTVMQMLRMSRLRANTAMSGTVINQCLMEYTPSNRVLSGELIVFQNEMIEIIKDMITLSEAEGKLTYKYVSAIIIEFFHALVENQIPQQPSL